MVLKFYKYSNKYLSLFKISIMVGLVLLLPLNTRSLFAEKKSDCSLAPSSGTKFRINGPGSWETLITVRKYKDDDKFLSEKIGLLKLAAAERFSEFFTTLTLNTNNKEESIQEESIQEEIIQEEIIQEDQNFRAFENFQKVYSEYFSWNDMKPILISMKSFHCYDDDQIVLSGKWTSDSVQNAYRHINLEKAYDELLTIADVAGERSILDDEKFKKKFPKLWETDDPEYVKNAIKYVLRIRGL